MPADVRHDPAQVFERFDRPDHPHRRTDGIEEDEHGQARVALVSTLVNVKLQLGFLRLSRTQGHSEYRGRKPAVRDSEKPARMTRRERRQR